MCSIAAFTALLLVAELNAAQFWRDPFSSVCDPKQLKEFTVMEVSICIQYNLLHDTRTPLYCYFYVSTRN